VSLLTDIVDIRDRLREFVGPTKEGLTWGLCGPVSWVVNCRLGWAVANGCYILPSGEHILHIWNVAPDGRYLDTTADQFGQEGTGVAFVPGNDPRYSADCQCDKYVQAENRGTQRK
jgi:hypothetical protein